MQIKEFQSEENAGERIDKFLTEKVPELSRSYIQKLIKEKNVKVFKIASGIPMGGNIEHTDMATLGRSLEGRVEIE